MLCTTQQSDEKFRHQSSLKEHSTTLSHMQKELESLRGSERMLRSKLRDMELDNDDLEKSERSVLSNVVMNRLSES